MRSRIIDTLFREPRLICRYYSHFQWDRPSTRIIFKADGRFLHGGMFDRLKGAVSVYAASQCIGREFRLSFTHPFDLRDYLEPNEYDWSIDESELIGGWPAATPVFMYGEFAEPVRLVKMRACESHFYYGYDSLEWLNRKFHKEFEFGALYNLLFKPSARLRQYIDKYQEDIGSKYVVAHFRFLNLIGDSTEIKEINPTLAVEQQDSLIERSLAQLKHLKSNMPTHRIMLATDSPRFVSIVQKQMPDVYVVPGEIKHIGTASDTSDISTVKMFLDYYLIAGAEHVYSFVSDGMWKSAFPEYAAKIGQKPFERIFY